MSLRDEMNQEAVAHGAGSQGGDIFSFVTGNFKMRIMSKPVAIATHFFGKGVPSAVCVGMEKGCPHHNEGQDKPSVKFMAYALIRKEDGDQFKLAELPWSVVSRIADFQEDEDYAFDGYPMPYDIKVKVDKENPDPKQIYKTEASPNRGVITEEEQNMLDEAIKKITPEEFVAKRKEKQLAKNGPYKPEMTGNTGTSVGGGIEYPDEEIDPMDIPF